MPATAPPPPTRILVIEDDRSIREMLRSALGGEGFRVQAAGSGAEGLTVLATFRPDLVILDWMLPDTTGLEVLRSLRRTTRTPVLFLTVRDEEIDKVLGLECGADDYVTKPFGVRELVARVRSLLRRARHDDPPASCLEAGPVRILIDQRTVEVGGTPVEMTRTEFDLLALLARHPGQVFSREKLLETVWGYDFEGYQRTVDSHITRVRKKIGDEGRPGRFIQTVWGVGYRFAPRSAGESDR